MQTDDQLDNTFAALAHPARRAMLAQLAKGEATVNELAAPLDMSLPAVSKHIRVLENAGLVKRGRDAQFRPCILNAEPLSAVQSWTEQYRPIWEARFNQMDAIIKQLQKPTEEDENG